MVKDGIVQHQHTRPSQCEFVHVAVRRTVAELVDDATVRLSAIESTKPLGWKDP